MNGTLSGPDQNPASGFIQAFEHSAARLMPAMGEQVFRILRDRGHSEDVVQEALLQMWQQRDSFDASRGSVRSWALAIVRRLAVDRVRHEQAVKRRELRFATTHATTPYDQVVDAVECLIEYEQVRSHLQELAETQRSVIQLIYFEHLGIAEAAARLGVPEPTVRTRLRDARRAIESYSASLYSFHCIPS